MVYIPKGQGNCQICGKFFKLTGPNHKICNNLLCQIKARHCIQAKYRQSIKEMERKFNDNANRNT